MGIFPKYPALGMLLGHPAIEYFLDTSCNWNVTWTPCNTWEGNSWTSLDIFSLVQNLIYHWLAAWTRLDPTIFNSSWAIIPTDLDPPTQTQPYTTNVHIHTNLNQILLTNVHIHTNQTQTKPYTTNVHIHTTKPKPNLTRRRSYSHKPNPNPTSHNKRSYSLKPNPNPTLHKNVDIYANQTQTQPYTQTLIFTQTKPKPKLTHKHLLNTHQTQTQPHTQRFILKQTKPKPNLTIPQT